MRRDADGDTFDSCRLKRLAVGCLLAASLMAVGSAPAEPKEDCSWGASSVIVEQMNGQYVKSAL